MPEILQWLRMRYKMAIAILVFVVLAFLAVRNLSAQAHVDKKAYDVMLSSLLSHSVPEMEVEKLEVDGNYVLLDAREQAEFTVSHVPGAVWVGYDDFDMSRLEGIDKEQPIVVYCSVGYRSEKIAERLKDAGYPHVSNLYGGIFEWVNHGVDMDNQPTENVHAYSPSWGVWLKKGRKVYE
jgi:rhodanese-related sulfurtransferase